MEALFASIVFCSSLRVFEVCCCCCSMALWLDWVIWSSSASSLGVSGLGRSAMRLVVVSEISTPARENARCESGWIGLSCMADEVLGWLMMN